jgi:hypothetical protein
MFFSHFQLFKPMLYDQTCPTRGSILAEPSAGLERSHPHLHGLLADGYWKDGVFTRFTEVDLKAIEQAFT